MPPRGGKKKAPAKKTPQKPKVEEPEKASEPGLETQTSVIGQDIVASGGGDVAEVAKPSEAPQNNQETVFMKAEDVSASETTTTTTTTTTTVVVEAEMKYETNESVVAQESNLQIEGSNAAEDGAKEMESEEDEEDYEPEEENGEGEDDEAGPEEDRVQEVAEGQATAVEITTEGGDVKEGDDSEGEENESGSEEEDDGDVDFSSYMQLAPSNEKKKQTAVEIFVGGLNRKAVEEDLTKVFGEYGEIKELRIVKHPLTHRSKGYAFISYATPEQAKKVLTDLKDGVEVKGKRAGVSPSQDSDTLYMGNICKTWTKEKVLEALKGFGVEQFDEIYLPEDPRSEGKIRGFAYLEFATHSDAMAAFQRLRKPEAVFGCNRSAKVAFAPSMHPSEEALSQVKTIYVEGLTSSWDEEKLRKLCEQYGEVEKVQLSRDLANVKRKDFGFVTFTSRENALACLGAINNAEIGEGDVKVKAELAKPQYKGRLGKNARGGYKVQKDEVKVEKTGKSNVNGGAKSKGAKGKGQATPAKSKSARGGKQPQGRSAERQGAAGRNAERQGAAGRNAERQGATAASKGKEQPGKGRKRDGRSTISGPSGRPSKKPRGNAHGRPVHGSGSRGRNFASDNVRQYGTAPAVYVDPYARGYAAPVSSYRSHGYGAVSDMEPHGGYLKPDTPSQGRDPYDYRLRRYPGHGGGASYAGGSVLPPSYPPPPSYPQYAPYEGGSGSGYGYPSSGSYLHRRPYY